MRLFEAILDAQARAFRGETEAGLRPAEFPDALPLAALTCIDARLNPLFPEVLGLPKEQFIWLRNAGNIITGPLSSTLRSLALACAVKGAREIAIIGHNDCRVAATSALQLLESFRTLGVERAALPDNLLEFFGLFASERQNVLKAVDFVRASPLIGPRIPVHGLLVDLASGRLEWCVNGYQVLAAAEALRAGMPAAAPPPPMVPGAATSAADAKIGEWPAPPSFVASPAPAGHPPVIASPPIPGRPPLPPRLQPTPNLRRWRR